MTQPGHLHRPRLRHGLYLVLTAPRDGYERLTEWAVTAGVSAVQFRPKGENDRSALRIARAMRAITRDSNTLFIVNERADLAVLCEADGVHLGQTDLPLGDIRRLIGDRRILGWSTHSLEQVRASNDEPEVDYIGFGPIHATTSKTRPDPVTGPELLRAAAALTHHPIIAIGGLTPERIASLAPDCFRCAAVIRAVADAEDPPTVLRTLQSLLENTP